MGGFHGEDEEEEEEGGACWVDLQKTERKVLCAFPND